MRTLLGSRVVLAGLLGLFVASCSDDTVDVKKDQTATLGDKGTAKAEASTGTGDKGAGEAKGGDSSVTSVSFASKIQPIFTANCAGIACHGGTTPKQDMNLGVGTAYAALVGVDSKECSTLKRVKAGDPSQSYLTQKLTGAGSCFTGSRMPPVAALSADDIASIASWIQGGALNN